ncbi:MAG: Gfo/Idh/MocA family oxidoreductase [Bacteroidetes bacterium]|jgi:predicted dehydrogenase|nr:Gfo/Idh/MocA family oxidoreductase [Bacteroidota bacterium]
MSEYNRRSFLKSMAAAGVGLATAGSPFLSKAQLTQSPTQVGMIGLDTSHSPAFTDIINNSPEITDFQVVAAYPHGSRTIESSYSRIPEYTEQVKEMGVEIVDSIEDLLNSVEVVLLETNDGHPHLEQSLPVLEAGKRLFIDKPIAGSLEDTIAIMEASEEYNTPIFSSSSLRYIERAQAVRHDNLIGDVLGADTYSPASLEESHPDLFWYGIHGVEILYTVMGTGCETVTRVHTNDYDIVTGTWRDGRLGNFRGTRKGQHGYGGRAFGSEEIIDLGTYEGYKPLLLKVLDFFRTGEPPVSMEETLEIYAFMEAADESKRRDGESVTIEEVLSKARA